MDNEIEIVDLDGSSSSTGVNPKTDKVSILETYWENLSRKEYVTNPAICREFEIEQAIEIL